MDLRSRSLLPCVGVVLIAAAPVVVGCTPTCDESNPGACEADQVCRDGACLDVIVIHEGCDGGVVGDGDGDATGDGDGDGDTCTAPGQADCDGDGVCENLNQNANHCGQCGRVCEGGCSGGTCAPGALVEGLDGALDLAVVGEHLYFVEHTYFGGSNGSVRRLALAAPDRIDNLASGVERPAGLAIAGDHVFFTELRYQVDDALWMASRAGPPVDAVRIVDHVDLEAATTWPYGIAASQGYVAWLEDEGLFRRGLESGLVDEVDTGFSSRGLLADDSFFYWVESGGVVKRLEVDFAPVPAPSGANVAVLPEGHRSVRAVAQDAAYLYISSSPYKEGVIVRVAKDGATTEVLVDEADPANTDPADDSVVVAMTTDATHIYWLSEDYHGRLYRAPLVPGAEAELLAEVDNPGGVAVDDTWVYWSEFAEGAIWRLAK